MAETKKRKKYTTVGYVAKGKEKEGTKMPDYIKVTANVTLKEGSFLKLESKKSREDNIRFRMEKGWLSEEAATKQLNNLEKWADYKRFEIVLEEEAE